MKSFSARRDSCHSYVLLSPSLSKGLKAHNCVQFKVGRAFRHIVKLFPDWVEILNSPASWQFSNSDIAEVDSDGKMRRGRESTQTGSDCC